MTDYSPPPSHDLPEPMSADELAQLQADRDAHVARFVQYILYVNEQSRARETAALFRCVRTHRK